MEKLCQDILAAYERRQELRKQLRERAHQLKQESTRLRRNFRKQLNMFRADLDEGREAWQKATASLAKKRQGMK